MLQASVEYTDTYGGEANYSWVHRKEIQAKTERGLVRKAKAELGLTGVRCRRVDFGDEIWLYPRGFNTVAFIYFND
jgi:hypothetical protein